MSINFARGAELSGEHRKNAALTSKSVRSAIIAGSQLLDGLVVVAPSPSEMKEIIGAKSSSPIYSNSKYQGYQAGLERAMGMRLISDFGVLLVENSATVRLQRPLDFPLGQDFTNDHRKGKNAGELLVSARRFREVIAGRDTVLHGEAIMAPAALELARLLGCKTQTLTKRSGGYNNLLETATGLAVHSTGVVLADELCSVRPLSWVLEAEVRLVPAALATEAQRYAMFRKIMELASPTEYSQYRQMMNGYRPEVVE